MKNESFLKSSIILIESRKEALALWVWCSVVACLIVGRGFPPLQPAFMSIFSTFFIALSVYVYNDVVDYDADKKNEFKSDRPLASGTVSRNTALNLIIISSLIGLGTSFLTNIRSFFYSSLYFVLFFIYSYPKIHLKKRLFVKEGVISSGILIIGLSVNYAILGSFSIRVLFGFLLFAVYAFCAMPTGFDSTDVAADRIQGVRTIASATSWQGRVNLAVFGMLSIMTITPFTYGLFGYNVLLPVSIAVSGIVFLRLLSPLRRSDVITGESLDTDTLMNARKLILSYIFVICICVILGSLNFGFLFT